MTPPPESDEAKKLIPLIMAITLAVFGGLVKELASTKEHTPVKFAAGMLIGAFTGVLAYCLCHHYGFEDYITSAICGASGYLGLPMLDKISKTARNLLPSGDK